jgi:hypothetical protein
VVDAPRLRLRFGHWCHGVQHGRDGSLVSIERQSSLDRLRATPPMGQFLLEQNRLSRWLEPVIDQLEQHPQRVVDEVAVVS